MSRGALSSDIVFSCRLHFSIQFSKPPKCPQKSKGDKIHENEGLDDSFLLLLTCGTFCAKKYVLSCAHELSLFISC